MGISVILPTYRSPAYLDLCLKSAIENRVLDDTEIVVVVDGYVSESEAVLAKYRVRNIGVLELPQNQGMANALNMGVWNASNEVIFIINDDNVFPTEWDKRLEFDAHWVSSVKSVVTVNQIEPERSIFSFPVHDLGKSADTFQYAKFLEVEKAVSYDHATEDGRIFPFLITKRNYMMVGGFDMYYKSPFWVDVDFWLKLELAQVSFSRTLREHLYHFGSRSTKFGPEGDKFRASEGVAVQQFVYKWGYQPDIVGNTRRNNTKLPDLAQNHATIRGLKFPES